MWLHNLHAPNLSCGLEPSQQVGRELIKEEWAEAEAWDNWMSLVSKIDAERDRERRERREAVARQRTEDEALRHEQARIREEHRRMVRTRLLSNKYEYAFKHRLCNSLLLVGVL